jgi:CheY-like chemotaxis protein
MATWMIVEDEFDFYEVVMAIYDTLGVKGLPFMTGEEALRWIEDIDQGNEVTELPSFALIDIRLPGTVSGVEVSHRLRQSPLLGQMGIIILTAYRLSLKEEKAIIQDSGCDRLLYKPLPALDQFRKILQEVMKARSITIELPNIE